jgi:CubicO group peptidase (beta-lactamase class C family)
MKKLLPAFILLIISLQFACKKQNVTVTHTNPVTPPVVAPTDTMYFPPISGTAWQTTTAASLGWDTTQLNALYPYLNSVGTKAFIILKNGRIVTEKYFGTFTADSAWYWASAGKTVTGLLIGIAQHQGILSINDVTSKYLGTGWTSESPAEENKITIRNQLTMTTGLDDGVADPDCTLPGCLIYKADAGMRWAYHNAPYTLLDEVVEKASGQSYNAYFEANLGAKIGMTGLRNKTPNSNNIFYSKARSMARFGLLMLNKGQWNGTAILADTDYFNRQVNTSQTFNMSYGYLTWLNGKTTCMLPQSQTVYTQDIIPNGPNDMYAALGKNDQKVYVVPSQKLVIIRMGNTAGGVTLATSDFDNTLWGKLRAIMKF